MLEEGSVKKCVLVENLLLILLLVGVFVADCDDVAEAVADRVDKKSCEDGWKEWHVS